MGYGGVWKTASRSVPSPKTAEEVCKVFRSEEFNLVLLVKWVAHW